MTEQRIDITSGVSYQTGEGFVELQWGDKKGQLTPTEARLHALLILEAADAAESDAFMVGWMREQIHAPEGAIARLLIDFRHYRDSRSSWLPNSDSDSNSNPNSVQ